MLLLEEHLRKPVEPARLVLDDDGDDLLGRHHHPVLLDRLDGLLGVIDDEVDDAEGGRRGDGRRADVHFFLAQDPGEPRQLPGLVLCKNGDLMHDHVHLLVPDAPDKLTRSCFLPSSSSPGHRSTLGPWRRTSSPESSASPQSFRLSMTLTAFPSVLGRLPGSTSSTFGVMRMSPFNSSVIRR